MVASPASLAGIKDGEEFEEFTTSATAVEPKVERDEPYQKQEDAKEGNLGELEEDGTGDADYLSSFWERQARRIARNPWMHLNTSMIVATVLSGIAMTLGGFEVSADNAGWQTRGTLIADRQSQLMLTDAYQGYLFYGGPNAWEDLLTNVQPGWESEDEDVLDRRRLLSSPTSSIGSTSRWLESRSSRSSTSSRPLPLTWSDSLRHRLLQSSNSSSPILGLEDCTAQDLEWYTDWKRLERRKKLWPIWKLHGSSERSLMDPEQFLEICLAEQTTQKVLEDQGLCLGCGGNVVGTSLGSTECLPPYSIVLYARVAFENGFSMNCNELADMWSNRLKEQTEQEWASCVADIKRDFDPNDTEMEVPGSCPFLFSPTLVEETYGEDDGANRMVYTSSIFATDIFNNEQGKMDMVDRLYNIWEQFDRAESSRTVEGAYDTQREDLYIKFSDAAVGRDMALACGSAVITSFAILLHTRSPFLTGIGLFQIVLSFPLSFFVYTFLIGLEFFPFLNFIGVFVVFALGADDIFVAVDKWKNARLEFPRASTEQIAAIALPDGAGAMFLTTITTAIAFFGTAICPVAPIKLFAIFCGLLIIFDYIMCVLLVFPALCIYDKRIQAQHALGKNPNCCIMCHCCFKDGGTVQNQDEEEGADVDDDKFNQHDSLIRRILMGYYNILHKLRWGVLVACAVGLGICIYFALTIKLPTSADVRILDETNQFELNYAWRQELLYDYLRKAGGSRNLAGLGLKPADTGDLNNPAEWSQLVLDSTFEPKSEEAQLYLDSLCPSLFREDFADIPVEGYKCPFNSFGTWVQDQSEQAQNGTASDVYLENCANAKGIPIPPESFHSCMIAWSRLVGETSVLSNEGKVKIMFFPFLSRVRWDSPFHDLDEEWNLIESWMKRTNEDRAPAGVNKMFFSSMDFWWYDTNGQMLDTAYGAAGIALAAAALIIFFSSRSITLTAFAIITIGYVLTSVTASLVGFGWTLGFLESICFAILIGVSVDFVIHFCHAYAHLPGEVPRGERTKFALIRMGPSILAAAFTTIAAAIIMLFTIITFFQKFALILFMTVIQASVGSFVVFLTMVDCMGPTNPTYLVDRLVFRLFGKESETDSSEPSTKADSAEKE